MQRWQESVGRVLYFRWPVKGPRSDRLVPWSTRSEFGLVVECRSRKSAPVVGIYSLLLPVSSERKSFFCEAGVVTLDWSRLASIICPSIFRKSIDVSRDTEGDSDSKRIDFY